MPDPSPTRRGWSLPAQPRIAVVGAGGLIGEALVQVLQRRSFPHQGILELRLRDFTPAAVADIDLVFLAAPAEISVLWAQELVLQGCIVIDLSEAWRLDESVPLVLSGHNMQALQQHQGLIACPNCTNGGLVRVIDVLRRNYALKSVVVTTFQAASGGGRKLLKELQDPSSPLYANVIPQCDAFAHEGSTLEEIRVVKESQRLLGAPTLEISVTCVRVPVEVGHSLSLWVTSEQDFCLATVRASLAAENDIEVACSDDTYPTAKSIRGQEGVFVGRIRHGAKAKQLQLWIVADNVLTGAASQAVNLAQALLPS